MADVEARLKHHLEMCYKVLEQYSWLLDSYILDFFTESHMSKLPTSWKQYLDSMPLEDIHHLLNFSEYKQNIVCPLSLLCIKILLRYLNLPRKLISKNNFSQNDQCIEKNKVDLSNMNTDSVKEVPVLFKYPKLWNLFLKHVKSKKRYEIFQIAEKTAEVANRLNVTYIVDIGSGLGHLSRILAYGFNLKVCSIETQQKLTQQALKLDYEFETTANKYLSALKFKNKGPYHINKTINFNLDITNFVNDLKSAFSVEHNNFRFGIVGLHPCGDLAAVLLKLYSNCSEAVFINLVGCCYHKLTTACDYKNHIGFPLTKFSFKEHVNISYEARALACHAIEAYCERLKSKNYDHLKAHCYRAALEKIIDKNWPQYKKSSLGNVKVTPSLDFFQYCNMALKKLDLSVPKEDLISEETLGNLLSWQNVVKYYSLRLMLAPLIETVILLDRKAYLLEKGFLCKIVAAFDPEISPRNQLLISEKP